MGKYQKNIENARSVTIMQYLAICHPGELVRKTDDEYCTKTHSSLVITPSKDLFSLVLAEYRRQERAGLHDECGARGFCFRRPLSE